MSADERRIIDSMEAVGTYKPEYLPTISRLAKMRKQYENLAKVYAKMVKEHPAELQGYHKPVVITTMESLRRDILAYERDLGLTPAALRRMDAVDLTAGSRASPTERLLQSLDDDDD